jgi:hypothetical protein
VIRRRVYRRMDAHGNSTKWCPRCRAWKRVDCFHAGRGRADGLASYCKSCVHAWRGAHNTGLDPKDLAYLESRESIADPAILDRHDREQGAREEARMGVRTLGELRARIAATSALKSAVKGRVLEPWEIDAACRSIDGS